MAKATWQGVVLAQSDTYEKVEGNIYFPPESINMNYFTPSSRTSVCPWKGTASYYDIVVDGKTNPAAAWTYKSPKPAASAITDHVAFWSGVKVES